MSLLTVLALIALVALVALLLVLRRLRTSLHPGSGSERGGKSRRRKHRPQVSAWQESERRLFMNKPAGFAPGSDDDTVDLDPSDLGPEDIGPGDAGPGGAGPGNVGPRQVPPQPN